MEEKMGLVDQRENDGEENIVIVGGGIGGLATALALHRKGLKEVAVYERSKSLREGGTAIGISSNGWRALDQLVVGTQLRDKAILIQGGEDVWVDRGRSQRMTALAGELRYLKRKDLINALADALPPKTIRFGHNAVAVKMDPQTMSPVLQLDGDMAVRAKVLIGCDGSNSKVADFLGMKPPSLFTHGVVRGLTNYPNGHFFPPLFARISIDRGYETLVGRAPVNQKLVYWFVSLKLSSLDGRFPDDPELMKQATIRAIKGYPADEIAMIEKCELGSLSFACPRYRHPLEMLVRKFHKGTVTVLGDAMHVMGPFLGQGGSAALEDAVVLARNLGQKIGRRDGYEGGSQRKIVEAFDEYERERRMRIVLLSTQTYLVGFWKAIHG